MFKKFEKSERRTYKCWMANWAAFQMTALLCRCWKLPFFLHNVDKLFLLWRWKGNYEKTNNWHILHNKHHLQYAIRKGPYAVDYDAFVIDANCIHYTQEWIPEYLTAVGLAKEIIMDHPELQVYEAIILDKVMESCQKLGFKV